MEERVASVGDLRDGQMKSVTVGGKRVLLARLGGQFYATGARCPHWGGSLPDGTLHGGRLICPLHGGIFDVRSGDLLEPPPMDGISSFPVRVEGENVYIERPDDARDARPMRMCGHDARSDPRMFAILGGGAAAAVAAEALRQHGYAGRILMISAEDRWPYDRPKLSKDYVAGTVAARWLPLRPAEFYAEHGIERLHELVTSFDTLSRTIVMEDGGELVPDAVLIATGSIARELAVPGAHLEGVTTLRSWDDADRLVATTQGAAKAVVIGSSFIGMEVAAGLASRGIEVTVVGPGAVPFEKTLGEAVGALVRRYHEQHGTRFVLGHTIVQLGGESRVTSVELDDGRILPADLVVVGIGVRPATSFVKGFPLDADGGLSVDGGLQVAPGVWAAGDIVRYPEAHVGHPVRIEHWRLAEQHGRAAARAMAGHPQEFTGVPYFWTQQFDREIYYAGVGQGWDEVVVSGDLEAWDFTAFYLRDGRLVAACGTRGREIGAFTELMRVDKLPPAQAVRESADISLNEWLHRGG